MRYTSTRQVPDGEVTWYTFEDAVLAGWADDDGMIVPESIPTVSPFKLQQWRGRSMSYAELAFEVFSLFVSTEEIPASDLRRLMTESFAGFAVPGTVKMAKVEVGGDGPTRSGPVSILELWHGPTCAFKDLGLQVLGSLLDYLLGRVGSSLDLLVGTSGDTGPAAIAAVRNRPNLDIVVLYPSGGRITQVQELQMVSAAATASNVHLVAVDGTSDDLDVPMEAIFRDRTFKERHRLGSVNSVNIVRVLCHAVNFFYAVLNVPGSGRFGGGCGVVVPTGAAGHLVGGMIAASMGCPMFALCAAVNRNDAMHRFLSTGVIRSAETFKTVAPAMDIQVPYNIERMLYFATGGDTVAVARWMERAKAGEEVRFADERPEAFQRMLDRWNLESVTADDAKVVSTMRATFDNCGYLADPHTSVGLSALVNPSGRLTSAAQVVVMGCAHPCKFSGVVAQVFGVGADAAVGYIPDAGSHPHVSATLGLLLEPRVYPPTTTLGKEQDWEAHVRTLVQKLTRQRETKAKAKL